MLTYIGKKRKVHGNAGQTSMASLTSLDSTLAVPVEENTCSVHMAERLSKLEQLFERFVCRKNSTNGAATSAPQSPPTTVSGSSEKISRWYRSDSSGDVQSESSIGDGIVSCIGVAGISSTDSTSSAHKHGLQHLQYAHSWTSKTAKNSWTHMTMRTDLWWLCFRHNGTRISSSNLLMGG
jgi:hypothetical protein